MTTTPSHPSTITESKRLALRHLAQTSNISMATARRRIEKDQEPTTVQAEEAMTRVRLAKEKVMMRTASGSKVTVNIDPKIVTSIRETAVKEGLSFQQALQKFARSAAIGLQQKVSGPVEVNVVRQTPMIASSNDAILNAAGTGKKRPITIRVINTSLDETPTEKSTREQLEAERLHDIYTGTVQPRVYAGINAMRIDRLTVNKVEQPLDEIYTPEHLLGHPQSMVQSGQVEKMARELASGRRISVEQERPLYEAFYVDENGQTKARTPEQIEALRNPVQTIQVIKEVNEYTNLDMARLAVEKEWGVHISPDGKVLTSVNQMQELIEAATKVQKKALLNIDLSGMKFDKIFGASLLSNNTVGGSDPESSEKVGFLSNIKNNLISGAKLGFNLTVKGLATLAIAGTLLMSSAQVANYINPDIPGARAVAQKIVSMGSQGEVKLSTEGIEFSTKLVSEEQATIQKDKAALLFKVYHGETNTKEIAAWVATTRIANAQAIIDGKDPVVESGVLDHVDALIMTKAAAEQKAKEAAAKQVKTPVEPTGHPSGPSI